MVVTYRHVCWRSSTGIVAGFVAVGLLLLLLGKVLFAEPLYAQAVVGGATFVKVDTTTQGTWLGVYGRDGFILANSPTVLSTLPAYAVVAVRSPEAPFAWAALTNDVRGLQRPMTIDTRFAATWYGSPAFTIDVGFNDGLTHRVGVYMVDWDGVGRAQRVDVVETVTGTVLGSRVVQAFSGGQYLVWDLRGRVSLRVIGITGPNAVMSALLFDPVTIPPPAVVLCADPMATNIGMPLPCVFQVVPPVEPPVEPPPVVVFPPPAEVCMDWQATNISQSLPCTYAPEEVIAGCGNMRKDTLGTAVRWTLDCSIESFGGLGQQKSIVVIDTEPNNPMNLVLEAFWGMPTRGTLKMTVVPAVRVVVP